MMAALKMVPEDTPEARLNQLKRTRSELQARAAQLTAARQRLDAATDGEQAATAALAELEAAEVTEMSAWAAQGAVGAPPAPDNHKRRELAERLASAQAASTAARGAGAGIDAEMAGLRAEVAAVEADIETTALDCLELERVAAMKELESVAAHAGKLIARVRSHLQCLGQRGRDLRDNGDPGRAQQYFILAEALAGKPLPDPQPSVADLDAARREWVQRFQSLRG